jgi:hypothetical protein
MEWRHKELPHRAATQTNLVLRAFISLYPKTLGLNWKKRSEKDVIL